MFLSVIYHPSKSWNLSTFWRTKKTDDEPITPNGKVISH